MSTAETDTANTESGPAPQIHSRRLLATCCAGMLTLGMANNLLPVCLTAMAADLSLGVVESGLLLSAVFWGLTLAIAISGPLADRVGFRALLAASSLLEGLGILTVGCSTTKGGALPGAALIGFGMGVFDALATPVVCALYPKNRARVANLLHAFYPVGMLTVIVVVLLLARWHVSWRTICLILAAACLPYGVACGCLAFPGRSHEGETRLPVRQLFCNPLFLCLAGMIFLVGVAELGASQWLPAFIETAAGGTRTGGALGLLVFGVTMAAGRFSLSLLTQRIGVERLFVTGAAVTGGMLLLAALPGPAWWPVACLGIMGFFVAGLWPSALALAGDRFPQAGASMYSVMGMFGNAGGLVAPVTVGLVAESFGLRVGLATLVVAPVIVLALLFADRRLRRRPRPAP